MRDPTVPPKTLFSCQRCGRFGLSSTTNCAKCGTWICERCRSEAFQRREVMGGAVYTYVCKGGCDA